MAEPTRLHEQHEGAGARFGDVAGVRLPRNYGDPAAEYSAVRSHAGLVDRADRTLIRVWGRDPVKMVDGLVTNDIAGLPEGDGRYAALLTPKGKMVADMRIFRRPDGELWLELDRRAAEGATTHFEKFVPPLFARFEDVGADYGEIGVYGPAAAGVLKAVLGAVPAPDEGEDAAVMAAFDGHEVLIVRTLYTGGDGYDLIAPAAALEALWSALAGADARPVGHGTLEALRIEAGRPRWGAELTEDTIPLEAGLKDRAISTAKGCYTGQEVIVRILHRGHVNWHLRGFLLDDLPAPARDTPLLQPASGERPRARITSACVSPRHGQTIGLGYAHRKVEPPEMLRLEALDGPEVTVVELPFDEAARPAETDA